MTVEVDPRTRREALAAAERMATNGWTSTLRFGWLLRRILPHEGTSPRAPVKAVGVLVLGGLVVLGVSPENITQLLASLWP